MLKKHLSKDRGFQIEVHFLLHRKRGLCTAGTPYRTRFPCPLCLIKKAVYNVPWLLQAYQEKFFSELFGDTLSFAGAVMIRRILGIAHVIDFESIKDLASR